MKTILSRTSDWQNHSRWWIVGYALLFWVITRLLTAGLMGICIYAYSQNGVNPSELTKFGGDPSVTVASNGLWTAILIVAVAAPVIEEIVFRLGLSFVRWQVAAWLGSIPLFMCWMYWKSCPMIWWIIGSAAAIIIGCLAWRLLSDEFLQRLKKRCLVSAMWITSIAFGLIHLMAFSTLSLQLLPYALVVISAPFFTGCACAYLRVNLGFGWGVAMHVFNNIPGIAMILLSAL